MARLDPDTAPLLFRGWTGEWVQYLQELLVAAGSFTGTPGGDFDGDTEGAVVAFQTEKGCTVDGAVGPETWRALQPAADSVGREAPEPVYHEQPTGSGDGGWSAPDAPSELTVDPQLGGAGLAHHVTVHNRTASWIRVTGVHLLVGDDEGSYRTFESTDAKDVDTGGTTVYSFVVPMGPAAGQPYLVNANAHAEYTDAGGAAHAGGQGLLTYTVDAAGTVGGSAIAVGQGEAKGGMGVGDNCAQGDLVHYVTITNDTGAAINTGVAHVTVASEGGNQDFGTNDAPRSLLPGQDTEFAILVPMGPAGAGDPPYSVTATGWVDYTMTDGTPGQSTRASRSYTVDNEGWVH